VLWLVTSRRARRWVLLPAVALLLVLGAVATAWSWQHLRAIAQLGHGVGDTVFLDASGEPWFRLDEQRRDVPFDAISPHFREAVIAIEDHRFYRHPGVDPIGLTRAAVHNLRSDSGQQGGSTITQQLARTLFLSTTRTYTRKLQEAGLALLLELRLSKQDILHLYMNRVYLSGGIYGIETMAQRLLGKPAADLTLGEAALIAGMIQAPAVYSPWSRFEAARERSFVVLQRMREEGMISEAQEAAAREERIRVAPRTPEATARHGYAKDWLRQQFRTLFGDDNPAGWTVQTTFVPELQDAAEAAVRDGLRRLGIRDLQAALVALDPRTGGVLAMVGGSSFVETPFNRAVHSRRQPGSAFKPFVYAVALERGFSPASVVSGLTTVAVRAGQDVWIPRDQRGGEDAMTLRDALLESRNAAAVTLQQQVGSAPVLRLASSVGLHDQPDVPSLALGSGLVTPLDLTAAYTAFPSLGLVVEPRAIVAVRDGRGAILHETLPQQRRVMTEPVAFQMVSMLQDVVERGTGASARALGVRGPVGGKTGTTNDARDAWFVGFSSSVVVGVWAGFDQPRTIRADAGGARIALPIWADFMRRTARQLPAAAFTAPPGVQPVAICRLSAHRAAEECPQYVEYFKDGDEVPDRLCPIHAPSAGQRVQRAVGGVFGAIGRGIRGLFGR
jgi:1A family penicillin-binding protein